MAESARGGDSLRTLGQPTRTRDVDWRRAVDAIRALINGNTTRLLDALGAAGYYPSTSPGPTTTTTSPPAPPARSTPSSPCGDGRPCHRAGRLTDQAAQATPFERRQVGQYGRAGPPVT